MEDYGYYGKSRARRQRVRKGSTVVRIIDIVMLVLTVSCSVALLAAYAARYVDPRDAWVFSFAGLVFPVLYVVEILLGMWWVARWKKYAWITVAVLLLGAGQARAFYKPDLRKRYAEDKPSRSDFVVMSYNVLQFKYKHMTDDRHPREAIADLINSNNIDILCIQEFSSDADVPETHALLENMKHFRFQSYGESRYGKYFGGLAVYSRYPIVASGAIPVEDDERYYSMWADIKLQRDTVRVFNSHLYNTHIDDEDMDYISNLKFVSEEDDKAHIAGIVRKLRNAYIHRAEQADRLAEAVTASPYPTIVCGDFNDTPASYAYRTVSHGLQDAFVRRGHGLSGTFSGFFNMFRIDFIFMTDGLDITGYYNFRENYSDHLPIAAGFEVAGDPAGR